jgi:hypothetical protein
MITHGADKIINSSDQYVAFFSLRSPFSLLTSVYFRLMVDNDIEAIIAKGEERTQELNSKYEQLNLEDLSNFKSDASVQQWEGEDFRGGVRPFRLPLIYRFLTSPISSNAYPSTSTSSPSPNVNASQTTRSTRTSRIPFGLVRARRTRSPSSLVRPSRLGFKTSSSSIRGCKSCRSGKLRCTRYVHTQFRPFRSIAFRLDPVLSPPPHSGCQVLSECDDMSLLTMSFDLFPVAIPICPLV